MKFEISDVMKKLHGLEQQVQHNKDGITLLLNFNSVDAIEEFYEEVIVNPEGELHHLNKDEKLKQFIKHLVDEEESDESEETKSTNSVATPKNPLNKDEYSQPKR